jgi:hypothetical protein
MLKIFAFLVLFAGSLAAQVGNQVTSQPPVTPGDCVQFVSQTRISDAGAPCGSGGGGAVSSVSNSDGTLTISPTTGAVIAGIALGHANSWSATQTFSNIVATGSITATGSISSGTSPVACGTSSGCWGASGGNQANLVPTAGQSAFTYDTSTNLIWGTLNGGAAFTSLMNYAPTALPSMTLPSGKTLTIASGATLTCAGGSTCPSGGGGDTITSPNSTLSVGGTSSATTLDVLGAAGKILAGATPALTYTPALGVQNVTAESGSLTINGGTAVNGLLTVNGTGASPASTVISGGTVTSATFGSATKCAAVGTGASPSLVACSAAPAGSFSCATNASAATCVVSTTAVTANSAIFVQPSAAAGTLLSVTCNTTADTGLTAPRLASISTGTSFTINLGTFATSPLCFNFWIIN